jgi:integrase
VLTCTSLPGNPEGHFSESRNLEDRYSGDRQARYIEAAVQGVLITSIYLTNGNPQPGPGSYGLKLGLGRIAWHTFRHTYRAWLDETGAPVGVQQKLMRHAHVSTTMDQYGNASALAKRKANRPIGQRLLQRPPNRQVSIQ